MGIVLLEVFAGTVDWRDFLSPLPLLQKSDCNWEDVTGTFSGNLLANQIFFQVTFL